MKARKKHIAALEFYSKSQYPLLLEKALDAEKLEKTWEEWHDKYLELKSQLLGIGINCKEVLVDIHELQDFCSINNYKNTETTRIVFVTYLFAYSQS